MEEEKRSNILSEDLIKTIYKYTDFKPKGKMIVFSNKIIPIREIYTINIYSKVRDDDGFVLSLELKNKHSIQKVFDDEKELKEYFKKKIEEIKESGMIYGIDELYEIID